MVNQQIAIDTCSAFIDELLKSGLKINQAVLFGSFATGRMNENSDIDLAIWDERFSGCLSVDYNLLKTILRKYIKLEVHTFNSTDTPENNPFVHEILKTGRRLR
jgi:predicted nucleotidyltransferase